MLDKFRKQVEVFGFYRHLDFCPHSSSVIEIAFAISMTASPREKRLRRSRARSFLISENGILYDTVDQMGMNVRVIVPPQIISRPLAAVRLRVYSWVSKAGCSLAWRMAWYSGTPPPMVPRIPD